MSNRPFKMAPKPVVAEQQLVRPAIGRTDWTPFDEDPSDDGSEEPVAVAAAAPQALLDPEPSKPYVPPEGRDGGYRLERRAARHAAYDSPQWEMPGGISWCSRCGTGQMWKRLGVSLCPHCWEGWTHDEWSAVKDPDAFRRRFWHGGDR